MAASASSNSPWIGSPGRFEVIVTPSGGAGSSYPSILAAGGNHSSRTFLTGDSGACYVRSSRSPRRSSRLIRPEFPA